MNQKKIIQQLWNLFSMQSWEESKLLFHKEFEAYWPQSKERFIGADNYVDMNEAYPGNHKAQILHLIEEGNTVSCTVFISADTGQTTFATSYFEFKDGKIIKATEFWAEEYAAPVAREIWRT